MPWASSSFCDLKVSPPVSLCCLLLVHGETGGDGKILIVGVFDARSFEIGAKVLSRLKGGVWRIVGELLGLWVGLKLSSGFDSGGDMRLAYRGAWNMIDEIVRSMAGENGGWCWKVKVEQDINGGQWKGSIGKSKPMEGRKSHRVYL